ncbi:MAG: AMP-binding protein [Armatimonadetes bacterium]|nr:AMP-binding protein [Armatimonadota bacterium]
MERSIRRFLDGRVLLVTGATGFLGKAVIEKILRCCPEVGQIFLLIRPKSGCVSPESSVVTRLEREILAMSLFDPLRQQLGEQFDPFVREKLVAVPGDLSLERLGLSDAWWDRLANEVEVIINSAATVVFDERLDMALELNSLGPARLLELAHAGRACVFLHVSTAYTCGRRSGSVPAAPVPTRAPGESANSSLPMLPADISGTIQQLRKKSRQVTAEIEQEANGNGRGRARLDRQVRQRLVDEGMACARMHGWNDTYTFTKALGEHLIIERRGTLPTVILRPAIIESSLREPLPGWIDGFRMADPLIIAYGRRLLSAFPADPNIAIDFVPLDVVVNALLGALIQADSGNGLQIFHVATSSENPLSFHRLVEYGHDYFTRNPMRDKNDQPIRVRHWPFMPLERFAQELRRRRRQTAALQAILQKLPGTRSLRARLAAAQSGLDRLEYYSRIYGPYVRLNVQFEAANTRQLFCSLPPDEQELFPFDVSRIDWRHYIQDVHIPGLLRHVLKLDDDEGQPVIEIESTESLRTINDLLDRAAARFPHEVAFQTQRKGEWIRFTYAQVRSQALQIARQLRDLGVALGDRVILYAGNQPEWGIAYLGAVRLGAAVVALDRQTRSAGVLGALGFTEAKVILTEPGCAGRLGREGAGPPGVPVLDIQELCAQLPPEEIPDEWPPVLPNTVASILFTSDTTVDPRAAMLTHGNFIADLLGVLSVMQSLESDSFLSVLPLYHAQEFTGGFLSALYAGATITYLDSLNSRDLLDTMRQTGTTALIAVPRLLQLFHSGIEKQVSTRGLPAWWLFRATLAFSRLIHRLTGRNAGRLLFKRIHQLLGGQLRVIISGGAALDPALFDQLTALGFRVCEGYGLTETAPILTINPMHRPQRGSVGLPIPGVELRIDRPDAAGIGEIVVRGPNVMPGYYRNPQANAQVFRDGWFYTGDLGYLSVDGYLHITGRKKDVIVTPAGKNVYPAEVEACCGSARYVREMCVLGVPNGARGGEEVQAVVVPDRDALPASADAGMVLRLVTAAIQERATELRSHQRIQKIHLWDRELPRTPTLSIDRERLKDEFCRRLKDSLGTGELPGGDPDETPATAPVVAVVARILGKDPALLSPSSRLREDLDIDSILGVEIAVALQEALAVELEDEYLTRVETLADLAKMVATHAARERRLPSRKEMASCGRRTLVSNEAAESALPRHTWLQSALRPIAWGLNQIVFRGWFRLKVVGRQHLPASGPFLIAANHTSHLDYGALFAATGAPPNRAFALGARDYFFNTPFRAALFGTLNVLPFDRYGNFVESLQLCRQALQSGNILVMFPEGTRSVTGKLQPFKPGIGMLALETGVPIVPACIEGAFEALPKGACWPRRRPLTIRFGPPLQVAPFEQRRGSVSNHRLYREIVDDLRVRIEALRDEGCKR